MQRCQIAFKAQLKPGRVGDREREVEVLIGDHVSEKGGKMTHATRQGWVTVA